MDSGPMKDMYKVLQIPRTASLEEVKERYRELALTLHPDRTTDAHAVERFKAVSEAYRVLSDSGQRRILDEYLDGKRFTGERLRADESFMDRLAGVERPRRRPGERRSSGGAARAFRFLEIALSPRVLTIGTGLALMSYIALGPRDDPLEAGNSMLVPAWFNHKTKRWETPAPWNPDYHQAPRKPQHRYMVFESTPPGGQQSGPMAK